MYVYMYVCSFDIQILHSDSFRMMAEKLISAADVRKLVYRMYMYVCMYVCNTTYVIGPMQRPHTLRS